MSATGEVKNSRGACGCERLQLLAAESTSNARESVEVVIVLAGKRGADACSVSQARLIAAAGDDE